MSAVSKKYLSSLALSVFLLVGIGVSIVPLQVSAQYSDTEIRAVFQTHGWSTNTQDGNYGFHLNQVQSELAAYHAGGVGIAGFIVQLKTILNYIVPFLVGLAVFIIIYGIIGYISNAADEEKRKEAKDFIIWGVIGVFIMISVWGLVAILVNTFNLDNSATLATDIYGKALDAGGQVVTDKSAVLTTKPTTLPELITRVNVIGSYLLPFLIGIGVFIIIFGIVNYIRQGDNEEKHTEARMFIIWGIVSVFIMLSIWGFVNILISSFQLDNSIPKIPDLPRL